jgi:hypothetical protein
MTPEDEARFMRYVERLNSGCWYWTGARSRGQGNRKWYGSFRYDGRTVRAHVFACDVLSGRGPLQEGHERSHVCDFSMCVNPAHIEVVPKEINQRRRHERARTRGA